MLLNSNLIGKYSKIALAVSGGPDSLAMLYLMNEKGFKFTALTVDHNLREESAKEAKYVSDLCEKLGIEHHILNWEHGGMSSNIHDKARKARYELITNFCSKNNIEALATAHHRDDRIENFFIRIHQGAGLFGLIDKDHIIYNGINVVRPLFHLRKQEILEYLNKNNIKYFEDPSNEDPKYLRSNIRQWIAAMPKELDPELFKKRIISVKQNLDRASNVIDRIYQQELSKVEIFDEGFALLDQLPKDKEIAYMILSKVLSMIGDGRDLTRLESIERLYKSENTKDTLGGCIIYSHCEEEFNDDLKDQEKMKKSLLIYREFGKKPPQDIPFEDGAIWDNRYKIHTKNTYEDLKISYLKQDEYAELKQELTLPEQLKKNKEIIFTLPAVKNLEKVIALPHINYYDGAYSNLQNEVKFQFIRKNQ